MDDTDRPAERISARLPAALIGFWPSILIGGAASGFYVAVVLFTRARGWSPEGMLSDVAAISDRSPFTGFLSNVGVLMMAATAAICFFAAALGRRREATLLLAIGAFTTAIFADDFLMLHSAVLRGRFGVPGLAIYTAYAGAAAAIAWRFRRHLIGPEHLALAASVACLAASIVIDLVAPPTRLALVAEEGAKFVGYALWCGYWVARAHVMLRATQRRIGVRPAPPT
jgi:hypothetical protein